MEFGIREIVALLVLLVLLGIGIGLLLRYQRSQRGRIKSRIRYRFDQKDDARDGADYGSELPKGGARVVAYRDPDDIKTVHQRIRQQAEASRPKLSMFRDKPEQTSLGLEAESEAEIPMLLDPAEMEPDPQVGITEVTDDEVDPLFMDKIKAPPRPEVSGGEDRSDGVDEPAQEAEPTPAEAEQVPEPEVDDGPLEVLVLNVIARAGTMLSGEQINQVLTRHGMYFGDMDIYHFDVASQGRKRRFSTANILNPGTFNPSAMAGFATPGLCFFMTLSSRGDNLEYFEKMLEVSMRVTEDLDAKLHDEQRSVITRQTLEHYRNRIRDFERRRMLQ